MEQEVPAFESDIVSKLPLANAVLTLMRHTLDPDALNALYEQHRGRCFTRQFQFSDMVGIVSDCLLGEAESPRESLLDADEQDRLPATTRAFYDKLSRIPIPVSMAMLDSASARLAEALPADIGRLPKSLADWGVTLVDGKVIKHVPRRLLPLRYSQKNAKQFLGGRALVAVDLASRLVLGFWGDADGESNEAKWVPELLGKLPPQEHQLFVGDRAFGCVEYARQCKIQGEFLLRANGSTTFELDPTKASVSGVDTFGRPVVQEWGWICRGKKRLDRVAVRRLRVQRDDGELVLFTSLTDAAEFPADDLLEVYLARWNIEQVFQEITDVFDLKKLIGTKPEAMLFQLSFCFIVYNILRVVKHHVAAANAMEPDEISSEMLFRSVIKQLTAACELIPAESLGEQFAPMTATQLRKYLKKILAGVWHKKWRKVNSRPRDPTRRPKAQPAKLIQTKPHDSVFRILNKVRK